MHGASRGLEVLATLSYCSMTLISCWSSCFKTLPRPDPAPLMRTRAFRLQKLMYKGILKVQFARVAASLRATRLPCQWSPAEWR